MHEEPRIGSRWRHVKRGSTYEYVGTCLIEATMECGAIYKSETDGTTWVRPLSEFMDGRFVEITTR